MLGATDVIGRECERKLGCVGEWGMGRVARLGHRLLALLVVAGAVSTHVGQASAQGYPTRPLKIVVGFAPGGGQDQIARLLGQGLTEKLGQQVLIDNRPGSGTIAATELVVSAPADGYTLLLVSTAAAINPGLHPRLRYDVLRDIAPVWGLIREASVLVVPAAFAARTLQELIEEARRNPGKINMASSGIGAQAHMAGELFKLKAGIDMLHVPYRGTALALIDLVAGRAEVMFSSLPGAIGHIRQGKLRALGIATAARSTALPDVPAIGEVVKDYEASGFSSIGAPRGTPADIIETLNRHLKAIVAQPAAQARFRDLGSVAFDFTPAELGRFIAEEIDKWNQVIQSAKIKPE